MILQKAIVNLFIYSPPKTASTAMFHYFSEHPQLNPCINKEPHYFSQLYKTYDIQHYNSLFKNSSTKKLNFEASTTYFANPVALNNIKNMCEENIKFIIVLRNPMDRLISNYLHFKSQYNILNNLHTKQRFINDPNNSSFIDEWIDESKKFTGIKESLEEIISENNILVKWSMYYEPIKNLLSNFNKENILIIIYEKFRDNNIEILKNIYKFLNIDDNFKHSEILYHNTSEFWKQYTEVPVEINKNKLDSLLSCFKKDINNLENLLNIKTEWTLDYA